MNNYFDYFHPAGNDRKPRVQGSVAVGDAIGNLITATVFGLTRVADDLERTSDERITGKGVSPTI